MITDTDVIVIGELATARRRNLDHSPGLVYVGLEFQRPFSSSTLRGVNPDAEHVITPLAAHVRRAPAVTGLRQAR